MGHYSSADQVVGVDQDPNGCWVACISSLTGIPLSDLPKPNWFGPNSVVRHENWSRYHNEVIKELGVRGWAIAYLGPRVPKGYAIASGPSPRESDDIIKHCVISLDGAFYWDPHSSRQFLKVVEEYEVMVRTQPYHQSESWLS